MAVDPTYPLGGSGVYRDQGHLKLTVGTSGSVVVEAGGKITGGSSDDFILTSTGLTLGTSGDILIQSGGSLIAVSSDVLVAHSSGITVGTSGTIAFSSGGKLIQSVVAGVTTADLPASGISTVAATSAAGAQVFNLAAPITGVRKTIICTLANATDTCTISSGTAVGMNNSGTVASLNLYRFVAPGAVELVGNSTANYIILTPNVTTVAFSTS